MAKKLSVCFHDADKKAKRHAKLMSRLQEMFRPFVEKVVRPLVEQEIRQGLSDEEKKEVQSLFSSENFEEEKDFINQLRDALTNPKPFTSEEIEEEVNREVANETDRLVCAWFETFYLSCKPPDDGAGVIDAKTIDGNMLPPLSKEITQYLEESFAPSYLDATQAREILRQVRASLPVGKVLPDEMVELLELNDIKVVM